MAVLAGRASSWACSTVAGRVGPCGRRRAIGGDTLAIGQKIEAASEATPRMLKSMMAYIERKAFRSEPPALLFMNVAHAENLDDDAGSRFDRMASRGIEVVVLGQGLRNSWTTSVRHGQLSGNDPLADEQAAVLITSELACRGVGSAPVGYGYRML